MSKSAKIRRMLAKGLDAKEIVKRLKVPVNLVHQVKYAQKKAKNLTTVRNSESRKAVLKRTMPKIEAEVRDMKAALDFLDAEKVQVGEMPKKLIVKPVNLKAAMDILDKHWVEFPPDYVVGSDRVNSPSHYTTGGIETIDFIEAKDLNYRLGNVIKYVSRAEKKDNPLEDLKKAKWYLEREIATRERA